MMPTALVGGAARRTAADGGRRTGGHGHVRVLKGYSNTGTQIMVLKQGVLDKGYSKRGSQKRYSKRVLKKGTQ